jgi:hypothetical protein
VDSPSGQQSVEPINEEKPMLKGEIERTTTGDVIRIGTSQVKLGREFNGPIVIDDQIDTVMKDVAPDHEEEKANKIVDSKYLQPRWCPPGLTRTQKRKLQQLRLAEMREKEREKRRDELFNEIKPRTQPRQEWKRKEAPQRSTTKSTADGQTTTPDDQTAQAHEAHDPTEDQVGPTAAPNSLHVEAGSQTAPVGDLTVTWDGQTMSPSSPTASSCRIGASSSIDRTSSPVGVEEDTDDDRLDYEPSPARNSMEINVVYLLSADYSLLEEEEISQLTLVPQDAVFKRIGRPSEVVVHSQAPGRHTDGSHVG